MIICDQQAFAFVHIPKCAGTSVRRGLRAIDSTGGAFFDIADHPAMGRVHLAHLTLADLAAHYPDALDKVRRYRSMAIVRDPLDRFQSAIFQRLREFKRIPQSAITPAMVEAEGAGVLATLDRAPGRLDLEHVHFNRQADFIELDGARVVRDVFALSEMPAVTRYVACHTGIEIGTEPQNMTSRLRFPAFRPVQRLLRDRYAQLVPSDQRRWLREKMANAGFYQPIEQKRFNRTDGATERFIRDYYARDFEILAASTCVAPARAA